MEMPYSHVLVTGALSRHVRSYHFADSSEGEVVIDSPPTGYPVLGHVYRGFCHAVVDGEPQPAPPMPFNIVAGPLHRKRASVRWSGGIGHAAAELTATGLWELFHVDADTIINSAWPMAVLNPLINQSLHDAFTQQGPGPAAFEEALTPLVADAREAPDYVSAAARRIEAEHGVIRLGEIFDESPVSAPTMNKWFRRVVGLPLKYFARVVQFNHVGRLILAGDRESIAQLAVEAGFFDQAHFAHVVREFVLKSPSAFLESDFATISTFVRQGDHGTSPPD